MTKDETGKLFTLLRQFYPNRSITPQLRFAWELVLEPYSYADVKAAAVAYVRKSKFFPDAADLTANLTPEEERQAEKAGDGQASRTEPAVWMLPFMTQLEAEHPKSVSKHARENSMSWDDAKRETEQGEKRKGAEDTGG